MCLAADPNSCTNNQQWTSLVQWTSLILVDISCLPFQQTSLIQWTSLIAVDVSCFQDVSCFSGCLLFGGHLLFGEHFSFSGHLLFSRHLLFSGHLSIQWTSLIPCFNGCLLFQHVSLILADVSCFDGCTRIVQGYRKVVGWTCSGARFCVVGVGDRLQARPAWANTVPWPRHWTVPASRATGRYTCPCGRLRNCPPERPDRRWTAGPGSRSSARP